VSTTSTADTHKQLFLKPVFNYQSLHVRQTSNFVYSSQINWKSIGY